jgi:hypothetical protein
MSDVIVIEVGISGPPGPPGASGEAFLNIDGGDADSVTFDGAIDGGDA